jgi:hypothetical protein
MSSKAVGLVGLTLAALLLAPVFPGCGAPRVESSAGSGGAPGSDRDGGGGGRPAGDGASYTFTMPEGGFPEVRPDMNDTCAEEAVSAKQVPVDLLVLMDSSDSMAGEKWTLVSQALLKFMQDPRSAGLGLGLQFFPQPGDGSPCQAEKDCPESSYQGRMLCVPPRVCSGTPNATGLLPRCDTGAGTCAGGATCMPAGVCSKTGADCTTIGKACPGADPADMCAGLPKLCDNGGGSLCSAAAVYQKPAVDIADLPRPALPMVARALLRRSPSGNTPLVTAVEGALAHLTMYAASHQDRHPSLVLATDAAPSPPGICGGGTVDGIAGQLMRARTGTPSISTYVIGFFGTEADLQKLATGGGTGKPFLITPMQDLGDRFFEALSAIRGQALPCEFTIPPPQMGVIDYGKVNVVFKGASSQADILYAGSMAKCDPGMGGWYYDVDPATGGTPTRIIACPATCSRFKADANAKVELRFGCKTRYIP